MRIIIIRTLFFECLKKSLDQFIDVCEKYSISLKAGKKPKNIFSDQIKVKLSKSQELELYFDKFNPSGEKIETGFTPIKLFSAEQLDKAQIGYEGLPENHIVFADDNGGGKPIMAIVDEAGTPVYANYDSGSPFKISDDLSVFISAITELVEIVYGGYSIFDIADDEDVIKDSFVSEMNARIKPILGDENFDRFFDYFYG